MLRTYFDIKIKIRSELIAKWVFGIKSRLPIAIILSFFGYREEVVPLLQILAHGTRAYIWNSDGLEGFLVKINLI